ncbi:MAG: hypothetical protein H0T40_11600 [Geodermatophilaceae bacterium]|nr:hypothetical protein [Geodermatophilaceae bacterium]
MTARPEEVQKAMTPLVLAMMASATGRSPNPAERRTAQPDRDGDRLVVVQQEWR